MKEKLGFQILFELKKTLTKNLNVRFVYIQSPSNEKKDEELDTYEIPCNKIGKFKVNFSVTPPRLCFEKASEIFGIALLLIQFRYTRYEFKRVGYYVNNELNGPIERDSNFNIFFKLKNTQRNILIEEPRVTEFFFL